MGNFAKDPGIVTELENRAVKNAVGNRTSIVQENGVILRYYPACKRFSWYTQSDPIPKWRAVQMLLERRK